MTTGRGRFYVGDMPTIHTVLGMIGPERAGSA
jgi:hypothetical protein